MIHLALITILKVPYFKQDLSYQSLTLLMNIHFHLWPTVPQYKLATVTKLELDGVVVAVIALGVPIEK